MIMLFAQWNYKRSIVKVMPLDLKYSIDNLYLANKKLNNNEYENPENWNLRKIHVGDEPSLGQWVGW